MKMTEDFSAFYKSQSNGKLNFSWTIAPRFTRLNQPISSYGVGRDNPLSNSSNYWRLNYDLQTLALKTYKREEFDIFIAVSPIDTSEDLIATSPAFPTKDARYWPGNWLGGDYWRDERKWFYPAHEFGHYVLGLDDLRPPTTRVGENVTSVPMGHYDIMNTQAGPELTSWNRWIGGLINDNQVLCLPSSTTVSRLKPIELVNDEIKGLVVPISSSKVLVIENRASIGYDSKIPLSSVGVIAYTVDVSIPRSQSPMKLIREPADPVDLWNKERGLITPRIDALKNGESLTYEGIMIRVIGQEGNDMFVEVKRTT
jgi:M6 family metalloprotease-like protein